MRNAVAVPEENQEGKEKASNAKKEGEEAQEKEPPMREERCKGLEYDSKNLKQSNL